MKCCSCIVCEVYNQDTDVVGYVKIMGDKVVIALDEKYILANHGDLVVDLFVPEVNAISVDTSMLKERD